MTVVEITGAFTQQDGITPASGFVRFTLRAPLPNGSITVAPEHSDAVLDGVGEFSIDLTATTNSDHPDAVYEAQEHLDGDPHGPNRYYFQLPHDQGATLDLNALTHIGTPPSINIPTPGPQGDPGPVGPDGNIYVTDSYAALRAIGAGDYAHVLVTGDATSVTELAGLFVWDNDSTLADDAGTVIKPATVSGGDPGRWRRLKDVAILDATYFGARDDPAADQTTEVAAALSAALALPQGAVIRLPPRCCIDNLALPDTSGVTNLAHARTYGLIGGASGNTVIHAKAGSTNPVIHGDHVIDYIISGFRIDGRPNGSSTKAASYGIDLRNCKYTMIGDIFINSIAGSAIRISGGLGYGSYYSNITQAYLTDNDGWGVDFDSNAAPAFIQCCNLYQVTCANNGAGNSRFRGVRASGWFGGSCEGGNVSPYGVYTRNSTWMGFHDLLVEKHTTYDIDTYGSAAENTGGYSKIVLENVSCPTQRMNLCLEPGNVEIGNPQRSSRAMILRGAADLQYVYGDGTLFRGSIGSLLGGVGVMQNSLRNNGDMNGTGWTLTHNQDAVNPTVRTLTTGTPNTTVLSPLGTTDGVSVIFFGATIDPAYVGPPDPVAGQSIVQQSMSPSTGDIHDQIVLVDVWLKGPTAGELMYVGVLASGSSTVTSTLITLSTDWKQYILPFRIPTAGTGNVTVRFYRAADLVGPPANTFAAEVHVFDPQFVPPNLTTGFTAPPVRTTTGSSGIPTPVNGVRVGNQWLLSGSGSPEGVVLGSPGWLYSAENGVVYEKMSGTLTTTGWKALSSVLPVRASVDVAVPTIAANTTSELVVDLTGTAFDGIALNDDITAETPAALGNGLVISGTPRVSSANHIVIRFGNLTTGSITGATRTIFFTWFDLT